MCLLSPQESVTLGNLIIFHRCCEQKLYLKDKGVTIWLVTSDYSIANHESICRTWSHHPFLKFPIFKLLFKFDTHPCCHKLCPFCTGSCGFRYLKDNLFKGITGTTDPAYVLGNFLIFNRQFISIFVKHDYSIIIMRKKKSIWGWVESA